MESLEQVQGQELIYAASGEPFKTARAAQNSLTQRKLDPKSHVIVVVPSENENEDDRFAIRNIAPPAPEPGPEPDKPKEKFFRARFNAKSNPNDTDDVHLSVNGETLVIQREQWVVLPERFLECADHATYPQFRQLPNEPRKIVANIRTYPYERGQESTREEYMRQKAEGTKKQKEDIKKYGYDLNPEKI